MKITATAFDKKSLICSDGVPSRGLKVADCSRILRENGAHQVEILFKTVEEYSENNLAKYSRRLQNICEKNGYYVIFRC